MSRLGLAVTGVAALLSMLSASVLAEPPVRAPRTSIVLWDERPGSPLLDRDQRAFEAALQSMGLPLRREPVSEADRAMAARPPILIVPAASASRLTESQVARLRSWAQGGGALIFDGESALATACGVRFGVARPVLALSNHLRSGSPTRWSDGLTAPTLRASSLHSRTTFYSVEADSAALVVGGRLGAGRVVAFATLYDDLTPFGFGRYNDLPAVVSGFLGQTSPLTAARGEFYFDPGFRFGETPSAIVARWRAMGARAVHMGAWYADEPGLCDYRAIIDEAHREGIAVYAWFEWPHVSKKFWNDHPECREKTALLQDAHVDWRLLINLKNEACRDQVWSGAASLLREYPWDGVDIAEIYLEPVNGLDEIRSYTPFNDDVRKEFSRESGFDPAEIFQSTAPHYFRKDPAALRGFQDYRRRHTVELTDYFLRNTRDLALRLGRRWEVVLTVTDTLENPSLADDIAVDLDASLASAKRFGATVEVQDPYPEWAKGPERYVTLGRRYRERLGDRPFLIDINVVDAAHVASPAGFATDKQTGTELFALWNTASAAASRVILYSEWTVDPVDTALFPSVMASGATVTSDGDASIIRSSMTVAAEKSADVYVRLDGRAWPCQNRSQVWVPAGTHRLTAAEAPSDYLADRVEIQPGEVRACSSDGRDVVVTLEDARRTREVRFDGRR